MSMLPATAPVTSTSVPVASSTSGRISSCRRLTSCDVSSSCGPEAGVTIHRPDRRVSRDRIVDRRQRGGLLGAVHGGHQVDLTRGALPEALDDQVVGLL